MQYEANFTCDRNDSPANKNYSFAGHREQKNKKPWVKLNFQQSQ